MTEVFTAYLQAGLYSGIMILAALLVRPFLQKAPRNILCLIWLLVGIRLLLPFQLESNLSLQPSFPSEKESSLQQDLPVQPVQPLPTDPAILEIPSATEDVLLAPTAPIIQETAPPAPPLTDTPEPVPVSPENRASLLHGIWLTGIALMLLYTAFSYGIIRHRVREAVPSGNGVWETHRIHSAFLLGYFRPRIYLPEGIPSPEREFILTHEYAHLQRRDNWWKLLGILCVSLHWYNPLVWLGYVLLCRDIEIACDQQVIRFMALEERKAYSFALLSSSQRASRMLLHPVTFGEINLKQRIRQVLSYRKPRLWITTISIVPVVVLSVCFMTVPKKSYAQDLTIKAPTQATNTQPTDPSPTESQPTEPTPPPETEPLTSAPAEKPPEETRQEEPSVEDTQPSKPQPEETIPTVESPAPSIPEETIHTETQPVEPPDTTPPSEPTEPPTEIPEADTETHAPMDTWDNSYSQLTADGVLTIFSDFAFGNWPIPWESCPQRITSVIIGDKVSYVAPHAFSSLSRLTQVYIGKNVEYIGSFAFYGCSELQTLNFAPQCKISSIKAGAFQGTALQVFTPTPNLETIESNAFKDCLALETVALGGRVQGFRNAFDGCINIKNITLGIAANADDLPKDCSRIETARIETRRFSGFPGKNSLRSLTLGKNISSIEPGWFSGFQALSQLTLEGPVTDIGFLAFENCTSLTSLTLPATVTQVGSCAFTGSGLHTITFLGNAPQFQPDTFSGTTAAIHYPQNNETWTEAIRQEYGSHLIWIPY